MSKKVLASMAAMLALAGYVWTGDVFATGQDALEDSRDLAVDTVQQVTGRAGADKYITYLGGLIAKADCYLNGPSATCDYNESEVRELTAALDEGARATVYFTTEHQTTGGTTTTSQATGAAVAGQSATRTSNAKNKKSEMPTSLPAAAYETASVAKEENATDSEIGESGEEKNVEVPETNTQVEGKTGVKDNAPVRIGLAALAGVAILTGGIIVIRKWSRGNV